TPTEPYHTPSLEAQPPSHTTHSLPTLPPVITAFIPTVTPSETTPIRQYTRRARIAQSSALSPVADKLASPLRDVSQGEACPTDSGFKADQDRANIAKSSTLPYDSSLRVISPATVEGTHELEINRRNLDEGEAAAERVSDDTEEMATILTSMDAATILASGVADIPTGSGSIPTASPPSVEKVQEKIDAQVARELEEKLEREDQRMSEQIAKDAEVARIHVEEELQSMIDGLDRSNETVAKYLQEYQQFASKLPLERRIELISDLVRYQDNYAKIARDAEIARIHAEEELEIMIDGLDRSNEIVAKYLQEYHQFASELPIEKRLELISDLVRYQDNYAKVHQYQT
nr:hypothetical protein [Tanacetum cinerariifolium]